MLYEIGDVRQHEGEGKRRWFSDDYFDLIIWFNKEKIEGFQLCYDKTGYERSITWHNKSERYDHNKIDEGDHLWGHKRSPTLVADGVFDKKRVAYKFWNSSKDIDKDIAMFVYKRILNYEE